MLVGFVSSDAEIGPELHPWMAWPKTAECRYGKQQDSWEHLLVEPLQTTALRMSRMIDQLMLARQCFWRAALRNSSPAPPFEPTADIPRKELTEFSGN